MQLRSILCRAAGLALPLFALPTLGHDVRLDSLHIRHPAAPATLPGQNSGVVYLSIDNEGTTADRLVSAASPVASVVSLHQMTTIGGIMRMREIAGLPLAPSTTVSMKADSGYHLMMTGLRKPLLAGDRIPLTLTFERAGKLDVSVDVGPNAAQQARPLPHQPHDMGVMPER